MTLTIEPEIEARLRIRAARDGQEAHIVAQTLLADALRDEDTEDAAADNLSESEIADARVGIRRGLEAAAQRKERPLSDYVSDLQKRRAERSSASPF